MSFFEIVRDYINTYSGVPGILFFLIFLRGEKGNSRIIFYIILASFLADIISYYFIRYVYPNSYLITTPWHIINYFLLSWLFLTLIPKRKKLILVLLLLFSIGTIFSVIFFYSFFEANTFIKTYSSTIITFLSILTFLEILSQSPIDRLTKYPVFWIVSAIFFYSSITLFNNLFQNYLVFELQVSGETYLYISLFNLTFNIAKNLMLLYAFILVKKGFPDYIHEPKSVTT